MLKENKAELEKRDKEDKEWTKTNVIPGGTFFEEWPKNDSNE